MRGRTEAAERRCRTVPLDAIVGHDAEEPKMKINLIGMILNNAGRRSFDGVILDDNGKPMPAADSLHHMIMEYANVVNGGTSDIVTSSREALAPYIPKVPCPVCGAEALHKMDILERVRIMPPNAPAQAPAKAAHDAGN